MKAKYIIGALVLAVLIFVGIKFFNKSPGGAGGTTLKVAANLPMTGDLAFYGEEISSSVNMFMEEHKDSLKAHNFNIAYDFQDNAGQPKNAVSVFQSQQISGFDIYMSGVTAQTAAIYDQVKATQKPHFVWSFNPFQLTAGENAFRSWVDLAYEGECFLRYIDSVKPKSVAFIYQDISSTQEQFNKKLAPKLKDKGISVVLNEAYDPSTTDFRNILVKVKSANPDIIIIYGFKPSLIELIKGLNLNQLKKDGNVLCSFDFLDVKDVLDPKLLDGIVTNVPAYVLDTSSTLNAWKAKFNTKYHRIPLFTDAYAYDCANIIYDAAKRYYPEKKTSLSDCLLATNIPGLTGPLAFSKTGELKYNVKICKFKDGKFAVLPIHP